MVRGAYAMGRRKRETRRGGQREGGGAKGMPEPERLVAGVEIKRVAVGSAGDGAWWWDK